MYASTWQSPICLQLKHTQLPNIELSLALVFESQFITAAEIVKNMYTCSMSLKTEFMKKKKKSFARKNFIYPSKLLEIY